MVVAACKLDGPHTEPNVISTSFDCNGNAYIYDYQNRRLEFPIFVGVCDIQLPPPFLNLDNMPIHSLNRTNVRFGASPRSRKYGIPDFFHRKHM